MARRRYVDSVGRVPRSLVSASGSAYLQHLLFVKMVLDRGGKVELTGLGQPIDYEVLSNYELNVHGAGNGTIVVEAVLKGGPE